MSIINDALKKVQIIRNKKAPPKEDEPAKKAPEPPVEERVVTQAAPHFEHTDTVEPGPDPIAPSVEEALATPPPKRSFSIPKWKEISLIGACVVACVALLVAMLQMFSLDNDEPVVINEQPVPVAKHETLQLKGIVLMEGRNVVLINDSAYWVGDTVQGMKIVDITMDEVKFNKNGKTKILRVKK